MKKESADSTGATFAEDLEHERDRLVQEVLRVAEDPHGVEELRDELEARIASVTAAQQNLQALSQRAEVMCDSECVRMMNEEDSRINAELANLFADIAILGEREDKDMQEFLNLRESGLKVLYSAKHEERINDAKSQFAVREETLQSAIVAAARAPLIGMHAQPLAMVGKGVTSIRLSELVKRYCHENVRGGTWKKATELDYQGDYAQFIKIIGDVMTDGIDKSSVVSAKDKWLNLPANINKLPALKGKSIDAILALGLPPQAATNVSKKWERIKSMFVWARANGYIAENFAAGIGIKSKATVREKFSDGDLKLLFESEEYKTHAFEEAFQFWVPLIALFSGARLEEICQLHLADVKAHEQGHFFHFTTAVDSEAGDIGHTKNLKNDSSDRLCPVHQKLIDLGLLIYIESQRDQGYKRLFTELKPDGQGKVSPRVSEWFTEYRKRKGVGAKSDRSTKVFHSFRHTMIAQLEQKGVPQDVREKLSGHKSKSITVSVYGSTGLDQRLVSNLAKLQFEIEFTPFKMGAIR